VPEDVLLEREVEVGVGDAAVVDEEHGKRVKRGSARGSAGA
jgi:hypothetical protein